MRSFSSFLFLSFFAGVTACTFDLGEIQEAVQTSGVSGIAEVILDPTPYSLSIKEILERRPGESDEEYEKRIKKEKKEREGNRDRDGDGDGDRDGEGDRDGDGDGEAQRIPASRSLACNLDAYRNGPEVSLDPLEYLNSKNASQYELKGRCSDSDRVVGIQVNGYNISSNPFCDRGRWQVFLDLSNSIFTEDKNLTFRVSHGEDSNVICETVRTTFSCPENYIPIPGNEDFYERSFCVMKYEAKISGSKDNPKAVSKPEDKPISYVSHSQAVALCKAKGSHYDLINNDQWQNIARLIEEEDQNWSRGRSRVVDGNHLNCGVHIGNPKAADKDDNKDCGGRSCQTGWDYRRRTHLLPNGQIIWDMCGNVAEIMKNKNTDKYHNGVDLVYNMSAKIRRVFGPRKQYAGVGTDLRKSHYWGLGEAKLAKSRDLIIRGQQGRDAGVFSVDLNYSQSEARLGTRLGFRCVYVP